MILLLLLSIDYLESSDGETLTISGTGIATSEEVHKKSYSNFKKIIVGEDVTALGDEVFYNCARAASIELPTYLSSIGAGAFKSCSSLIEISIPNGVTQIPKFCFASCSNLQIINISRTVENFDPESSFSLCTSISKFNVNENNEYFSTVSDGEILTNKNQTIAYRTKGFGIIKFPSSIQILNQYCSNYLSTLTGFEFSNDSNLSNINRYILFDSGVTSIIFPASLKRIEANAFYRSRVTSLVIKNASYIDPLAFDGASSLKKIEVWDDCKAVSVIGEVIYNSDETKILFMSPTIQTLTLSTSVSSIGTSMITDRKSLSKVEVKIGNPTYSSYDDILYSNTSKTLYACPYLKVNVSVHRNCATIDRGAFKNTRIQSIVFEGTAVTKIGIESFAATTQLKVFPFPPNLETIEQYAFHGVSLISDPIVFPPSLKTIGITAFYNCKSVPSFNLSATKVTSLERNVFQKCASMTAIYLPPAIGIISSSAFYESGLVSIKIPAKCQSIDQSAFEGSSLSSIDFSECTELVSIGISAFSSCPLVSVSFPDSLLTLSTNSFSNCKQLSEIYFGENCKITEINAEVFSGCDQLKEVNFSKELSSLDPSSFIRCTNLIDINVDFRNPVYSSIDGAVYSDSNKTLVICPGGRSSFEVPNFVTSIGFKAFYFCMKLERVEFVGKSLLEKIGESTFTGCSSLESIKMPYSLVSLEKDAFKDCSSLSSIYFDKNCKLKVLGTSALAGCSNLATVYFDEGSELKVINESALSNSMKLETFIFPPGVTTIMDGAFSGCELLNAKLPMSLTSIGGSAFAGCKRIEMVNIPINVSSIGDEAFSNCNIKIVYYCGSSELIGSANAFEGCPVSFCYVSQNYDLVKFCGLNVKKVLDKKCNVQTEMFTMLARGHLSFGHLAEVVVADNTNDSE